MHEPVADLLVGTLANMTERLLDVVPGLSVLVIFVVSSPLNYAASHQGSKAAEIAKDSIVGGLGGAALGAGAGAIFGGGRGAARGAAIGGVVGLGAGALYGINENNKNDQACQAAYASCLRSRGY